jgi:anti-sigma regulatory factor (Ser/Thr protein kinase)
VLINLTSNAVKFTERGEVGLRARLATIDGGRVDLEFVVTDTGLGIAPADQLRMFEPFAQADASTTRRFGGTGLGLAICHRLVDAMGGELTLDSTPGGGTTFRCTVPMASARCCTEVTAGSGPPRRPGRARGDDNDTNRFILESQLTAWGMQPVLAADWRHRAAAAPRHGRRRFAVPDRRARLVHAGRRRASTWLLRSSPTRHCTRRGRCCSRRLVRWTQRAHERQASRSPSPSRSALSELHDALVRLAAPLTPPVARDAPMPASALTPATAVRGRVLVVEDNHVNQMVAEGVLRKLGYAVEVAADGRAGLAAMESAASTSF